MGKGCVGIKIGAIRIFEAINLVSPVMSRLLKEGFMRGYMYL
jgi:hypothetical protein